jgi:hypothetical protein
MPLRDSSRANRRIDELWDVETMRVRMKRYGPERAAHWRCEDRRRAVFVLERASIGSPG